MNTNVEFVFGEKLCDRVVNVSKGDQENEKEGDEANEDNQTKEKEEDKAHKTERNTAKPEQPVYYAEHEIDNYSEILKLNCKLYCLESDKATWNERGFGILKIIETSDKSNLQLSTYFKFSFLILS